MDQLTLKVVTIRKPHNCWGCTKEFPIGTEMTISVVVDQGEFSSSYWCEECNEIMNNLDDWNDDEFLFGELKRNYEEDSNEVSMCNL